MSNRLLIILTAFGFLLFLLAGPLWSFPQVESQLDADARAAVGAGRADGFTWQGRNGYLLASAPDAHATAAHVERLAGVRSIKIIGKSAATDGDRKDESRGADDESEPQRFVLTWGAAGVVLDGSAPAELGPELKAWGLTAPTLLAAAPQVPELQAILSTLRGLTSDLAQAGQLTVSGQEVEIVAQVNPSDEARVRAAFAGLPVKLRLVVVDDAPPGGIAEALQALGPVEFEFDSTEPTEETTKVLGQVPAVLTRSKYAMYRLVGHTDSVGTPDYNQGLSERRALAVRKELLRVGVPAAQLRAEGRGEQEPLVPNDTAEQRQHNRRVEFVLEEDL